MHRMTLRDLLRQVRVETGQSLDPAHGLDQDLLTTHLLTRIQRQLAEQVDWPILTVQGCLTTAAGQKLYTLDAIAATRAPSNIFYDFRTGQITKICLDKYQLAHLSPTSLPTDLDKRGSPKAWSLSGDSLLLWPTPDHRCPTLTLFGKRAVAPLKAPTDFCDLDGDLLVLFCAAEIMMDSHQSKARHKLSQAANHLMRLRAQFSPSETDHMRQVNQIAENQETYGGYQDG